MIVTCEECSTTFALDDALVKNEGSKVRCSRCRHVFTVFPPPSPSDAEDAPLDLPPEKIQAETQEEIGIKEELELEPESGTVPEPPETGADPADVEPPLSMDMDSLDLDEDFSDGDVEFETGGADSNVDLGDIDEADIEIQFDDEDMDLEMDTGLSLDQDEEDSEALSINFDDDLELEFDDAPESDDLELELETSPESGDLELEFDDAPESDDLKLELETPPEPDDLKLELESPPESDDLEIQETDVDSGIEFDADNLDFDDSIEEPVPPAFEPEAAVSDETKEPLEPSPDPKEEDPYSDDGEDAFELDFADDLVIQTPDKALELEQAPFSEPVSEPGTAEVEEPDFSSYDQVLEQEVEPEIDSEYMDGKAGDMDETEDRQDSSARIDGRPEDFPAEKDNSEPEDREIAFETAPPRRHKKRSAVGKPVILIVLVFLITAGAYALSLSMGYKIPFLSNVKIPFIQQFIAGDSPSAPEPKPVPSQKNVNGRFISNKTAGELFIITGKVENPAKVAYSYIQVRGTLLTKEKVKAKILTAYCGNVLSEDELKNNNIDDINQQLSVKEGMNQANVNLNPQGAVPFMLVFSDLPENLQNFTVEVSDFKKTNP